MQRSVRRRVGLSLLVGTSWILAGRAEAADAEGCRFSGVAEPNVDTNILDAKGQAIARFTGTRTPIEVKEIPVMPNVLARIATSNSGAHSLRIEGLISVRALGIRATASIEVIPSILTLPPGTRLDAVVRVGNELFVEKRLEREFFHTFAARVDCSKLGFSDSSAYLDPLPPKASLYRLDSESLLLFDSTARSAEPRLSLTRRTAPVLFTAVKTEGNWVSLRHDGEVSITGWAKKKDLTPLPVGEMQDQLASAVSYRTAPRLALGGSPQLMRASLSAPVRVSASANAATIGELEAEAEFYVIEVVSGWASVVPKSLGVMPAPERHFWVQAKAIGL